MQYESIRLLYSTNSIYYKMLHCITLHCIVLLYYIIFKYNVLYFILYHMGLWHITFVLYYIAIHVILAFIMLPCPLVYFTLFTFSLSYFLIGHSPLARTDDPRRTVSEFNCHGFIKYWLSWRRRRSRLAPNNAVGAGGGPCTYTASTPHSVHCTVYTDDIYNVMALGTLWYAFKMRQLRQQQQQQQQQQRQQVYAVHAEKQSN